MAPPAEHPHAPALSPVMVRPAQLSDAEAITAIYNEGIRGRSATFETRERQVEEIVAWFSAPSEPVTFPPHPFLVAERDGAVCGWIHASVYRARDAYRRIAEYSVYVAGDARGLRVGDVLMATFIPACERAGFVKLVARIFPENRPSLSLCARHGFRVVGTYEKHGTLDGEWRDVVIVERLLPANL